MTVLAQDREANVCIVNYNGYLIAVTDDTDHLTADGTPYLLSWDMAKPEERYWVEPNNNALVEFFQETFKTSPSAL